MRDPELVRLLPHRWTPLPGTGLAVWWDGEQAVSVRRSGSIWNLSSLVRSGRVLAWAKLADRPELGAWPIVPLASGTTYRGTNRIGHR